MERMDHKTWAKTFNGLLKKEGNPVAKLRAFHREVRKVAVASVGDWHVQQVAGMLAIEMADHGKAKDAAQLSHRLAEESHSQMMYHVRSARDKALSAAELYDSLGNARIAKRLRDEAEALGTFMESRLKRKRPGKRMSGL